MSIEMIHGAKSWLSDPHHPNYEAAARAIEKTYGIPPDYSREGGSIPITSAIEDATGMNVLLLPIGASDDMAHSQNEKYNISNLVNGIKVCSNFRIPAQTFSTHISNFDAHRFWGSICTSWVASRVPSLPCAVALP